MKKAIILILVLIIAVGCSQNKKKPGSEKFSPSTQPSMADLPAHDFVPATKGAGTPDIISDEILAAYSGVLIEVVDKNVSKSAKLEVPFNTSVEIEGTPLVLEVVQFYPDFIMTDKGYDTRTMNPNNVAAKVKVSGTSNEFEGWLFADFPGVHPYENPDYDVVLLGALKK